MTNRVLAGAGGAIALAGTLLVAQTSPAPSSSSHSSAKNITPLRLTEIADPVLRADTRFLSSDLLEGRAPSTRGGQLAAEYIAARFAAIGLRPAAQDGSYFQPVTIVESKIDPTVAVTVSGGSGAPDQLKYATDVVAFSGVEQPDVSADADVIFVGYGINAPEQKWNDYAGVDVKGKLVLMMVNDPPAPPDEPGLFGGPALTYYGRWTYKYEEAARQGAAGAILIHTTPSASYPWQVVQTAWTGTQYSLPVAPGQAALPLKMWVTEDIGRRIASRAAKDLDQLRTAAAHRGFTAVPLGVRVSATLHQTVARKESPNVIGVLAGTEPTQGVIYTAHYDHFGIRDAKPGEAPDADRINNGAVDNASGVSGILAIASAFARAPLKPRRSVYFLATTAEESGLLGAEYFVQHSPIPVGRIAADINVDSLNVLGPTRDLVLLGAERSTLGAIAKTILERRRRTLGVDTEPGAGYFFRSDHFPFAKSGVPALSITEPNEYVGKDPAFAKKQHEEYRNLRYHQPSDEYDPAWDFTGAIADLQALAELGWDVATAPAMPVYHRQEQFAQPRLR
jgi:Zn-dependent M28 family amino/carboxypeptidase